MAKKDDGFQWTIDLSGDGRLAATGVRRTLHLDDDDGSVLATKYDPVTLEKMGEAFPIAEFVGPALQAALLKAEATDQLQAGLAAAQETIKARDAAHADALKAKDALIEQMTATIIDRDNFIAAIYQDQANKTAAIAAWINARPPQQAKED